MHNEATGLALLKLHMGCATVLLRLHHVPEPVLVGVLLHLHRPAMGVLHSTGSTMTASAALIMHAAATPYRTAACWSSLPR